MYNINYENFCELGEEGDIWKNSKRLGKEQRVQAK